MASSKKTPHILLALITGAVAILVAVIQFKPWQPTTPTETERERKPLVIAGTVVDESSNEGLGQVQITVAGRPERALSEDSGNFYLRLETGALPEGPVRLRAKKNGYQPLDVGVTPPAEGLILQLKKI